MTFNSNLEGVPTPTAGLPRRHATPWCLERSSALLERARARIPGLTFSMMKRPDHFAPGSFPVYLARGRGALVLDEIVTGFRLALAGAQELFDVRPDLSCFSKAMAAGMPLSAVVRPREHLEVMDRLQVSTTFGGELVSLAVCVRALEICRRTPYVQHLAELGRALADGVNRVAEQVGAPLRVRGYDAIPFFLFALDPAAHAPLMRAFQGHMAKRGVLLRRDLNFICAAHTRAQIEHTVAATHESLIEMRASGAFGGPRDQDSRS